jgi:predicted nucleic acid-binding protein
MNRQTKLSLVVLLLISVAIPAVALGNSIKSRAVPSVVSSDQNRIAKQIDFRNAMRKLWEDHITWTRLFIVSAAADLPDKGPTTDRLLQNQVDLGNAVKPYYGDEAGEKLTALLKEHITTAAELVTGAKANDTAKMADANRRWYANADAIAALLSSANPKNWPLGEMKRMMHEHLDLTTAEVQARLKGEWSADVAAYERVHEQILHMADMLSAGIISQFSKRFD